jgi:hypothetical protein
MTKKSGSCLCGEVKITANNVNLKMGACHCGMCTKWSSGAFLALECGEDVTIEGNENITYFDSSDWAWRCFCSKCGTTLFYKLKGNGHHMISAGLFDDTDVVFDHQIFIDKKPQYYTFSNVTEDMTEAEVFAKHS